MAEILRRCWNRIADSVSDPNVGPLNHSLWAKGIYNDKDRDAIDAKATAREKMVGILGVLEKKVPQDATALDGFLEELRKLEYDGLADELESTRDELANARVREPSERTGENGSAGKAGSRKRSTPSKVTSSSRKRVKAPRAAGVGEPSECTGVNRGRGKTDSRKRSTPSKVTSSSREGVKAPRATKDVGNLPSEVFQHFIDQMADAFSVCPDRMANKLYSKGLISKKTWEEDNIASVSGYKRATTLLFAAQATLSFNGDQNLRKLCKTISQVQTMKELSTKIMDKYERALARDNEMSSSESERSESDSDSGTTLSPSLSPKHKTPGLESETALSRTLTSQANNHKGHATQDVPTNQATPISSSLSSVTVNPSSFVPHSFYPSHHSHPSTINVHRPPHAHDCHFPSAVPSYSSTAVANQQPLSQRPFTPLPHNSLIPIAVPFSDPTATPNQLHFLSPSHTMPQNEATRMEPCQPLPTPSLPDLVLTYKDYLKAFYNRRRFPTYFKNPLVQIQPKDFIKVRLVHINKILTKLDKEKAQHLCFLGKINELCEERKSLDLDHFSVLLGTPFFTRFLVEGIPGIGKTTFAWELCRQWKEGKLSKQFDLVLLAQVRSDPMRKAVNLLDMVHHREKAVSEAVVNHLHSTNGSKVLIIVEGYDEATSDQQAKESIFSKLLDGTELPDATLLVTSRPPASRVLPEAFCEGSDLQRIEIVGFTEDEIELYIESALQSRPDILASFRSYLRSNPLPHSLMYIPLQCSILTELYTKHWGVGDKEFAPKTMTELYTALVMSLLLRYLSEQKRHPHRNDKVTKLSELPGDVYQKLMDLAKTAAEGIEQRRYSFTDLPEDTMGLTQKMEELYPNMGSGVVTHAFLHLTLQEFLAAYFFAETSSCQLQQLLSREDLFSIRTLVESGMEQKHVSSDSGYHWPVLLFLGGLTGLHQVEAKFFRSFLGDRFHPSFCQLLYEAQNVVLVESIFASGKFHAKTDSNPMHWYVHGYCIAHSSSTASWSVFMLHLGENEVSLFEAGLKLCQRGRITEMTVVAMTMSSTLCRIINHYTCGITRFVLWHVKESQALTVTFASSLSSLHNLHLLSCDHNTCIPFLASLSHYSALEVLMLREYETESCRETGSCHPQCVPSLKSPHTSSDVPIMVEPNLSTLNTAHFENDGGILALSRALQSPHCHVKTLDLSWSELCYLSPESEVEFLQAVAMNKSLHALDYAVMHLSRDVFATLAHLLQHQTTLFEVRLQSPLDSIEFALLLVQAMKDSNVTHLELTLWTGATSEAEWMATLREHSFPSDKIALKFIPSGIFPSS